MNTTITSITHFRVAAAGAIVGALISSFGAVCSAADVTDVPTTTVRFADLDLSTSAGAATLYSRIRFAAEGVCAASDRGDLASKMHQKACVKQAIGSAVAKVDRPTLTAVYEVKYGAIGPTEILTAQRR